MRLEGKEYVVKDGDVMLFPLCQLSPAAAARAVKAPLRSWRRRNAGARG